jgi:hypothetical protein
MKLNRLLKRWVLNASSNITAVNDVHPQWTMFFQRLHTVDSLFHSFKKQLYHIVTPGAVSPTRYVRNMSYFSELLIVALCKHTQKYQFSKVKWLVTPANQMLVTGQITGLLTQHATTAVPGSKLKINCYIVYFVERACFH